MRSISVRVEPTVMPASVNEDLAVNGLRKNCWMLTDGEALAAAPVNGATVPRAVLNIRPRQTDSPSPTIRRWKANDAADARRSKRGMPTSARGQR
jgi:hypothetical protein